MDSPLFVGDTLDDLMKRVIEALFAHGDRITSSKGDNRELRGLLLELSNPRARLSRTETRGKAFSALAELCWFLAKSNDTAFISYYIPYYATISENGMAYGGYGPRLFDWDGVDQVANVIALLRSRPTSRQAVIQLFDADDIVEHHEDVPCTCVLQFMLRADKLHMFTTMRSNDAYWGLPHDVFVFTMLQEIVARSLSVDIGIYRHSVGSMHIYDAHEDAAKRFIGEGWQPTTLAMPDMPMGDPSEAINVLLRAEANLRISGTALVFPNALDSYWKDLIRLLHIFRMSRDNNHDGITAVRAQMSDSLYNPYIDGQLGG